MILANVTALLIASDYDVAFLAGHSTQHVKEGTARLGSFCGTAKLQQQFHLFYQAAGTCYLRCVHIPHQTCLFASKHGLF